MKKRTLSMLLTTVAALAALLVGSAAQASQNGDSIGIAFGREYGPTSFMFDTDVAGVPAIATANWNNEQMPNGADACLLRDIKGVASPLTTQLTWASTNDWSSTGGGEENNNFPGDNLCPSTDRKLMTGYLDNTIINGNIGITITITGLPSDYATYDVYIYVLGGVPSRGGQYTVNGTTLYVVGSGEKDPNKPGNQGFYSGPDYVAVADGTDTNFVMGDWGNYVVFPSQTGDLTITTASTYKGPTGGVERAPVNAVEIVNTSMAP